MFQVKWIFKSNVYLKTSYIISCVIKLLCFINVIIIILLSYFLDELIKSMNFLVFCVLWFSGGNYVYGNKFQRKMLNLVLGVDFCYWNCYSGIVYSRPRRGQDKCYIGSLSPFPLYLEGAPHSDSWFTPGAPLPNSRRGAIYFWAPQRPLPSPRYLFSIFFLLLTLVVGKKFDAPWYSGVFNSIQFKFIHHEYNITWI